MVETTWAHHLIVSISGLMQQTFPTSSLWGSTFCESDYVWNGLNGKLTTLPGGPFLSFSIFFLFYALPSWTVSPGQVQPVAWQCVKASGTLKSLWAYSMSNEYSPKTGPRLSQKQFESLWDPIKNSGTRLALHHLFVLYKVSKWSFVFYDSTPLSYTAWTFARDSKPWNWIDCSKAPTTSWSPARQRWENFWQEANIQRS